MTTADDSLTYSSSPPPCADADYGAIRATIVATERGRWFLDQYIHRYRGSLAVMLEAIAQARGDVGRHGDPGASGEAAVADLRNAAEQIRELTWPAQKSEGEPDLSGLLSFQFNRLASAGERLDRSLSGLRVLLSLLDELEMQLRRVVNGTQPAASMVGHPAPAEPEEPRQPGDRPDPGREPERHQPDPTVSSDSPAEQTDAKSESMWSLAATEVDAGRAARAEVSITDWALAPPEDALDAMHQPLASVDLTPGASALQRLEAREYRRRPIAAAGAGPMLDTELFDNDGASETEDNQASEIPPANFLTEDKEPMPVETAEEDPARAGSLHELGRDEAPDAAPEPASAPQAMPAPSDSPAGIPLHTWERNRGDDTSVMVQRLKEMRSAIASLMEEVTEKTARRIPPPSS